MVQFAASEFGSQTTRVIFLEQLINSLPAVLRSAESSNEVYTAACVAVWNHCVGEALRKNSAAQQYSENRLTVAVVDAIWQRQLQQMSDQLLYRLNSLLGQPLLRKIQFIINPDAVAGSLKAASQRSVEPKLIDFPPEIISAATNIHDAELRRAFLGAANSCLDRLKRNALEGTNAD